MSALLALISWLLWLAPLVVVGLLVGAMTLVRAVRDLRQPTKGTIPGVEPLDEESAWRLSRRLRAADIFAGLTDDELRLVIAIGRLRTVVSGQVLARAGKHGTEIFTILEGELRLVTADEAEGFAVRVAREYETVPLAALLDPPVLVTSIEPAVDSLVFSIPAERLVQLCNEQPRIGLEVYRVVTKSFERRYRATLHSLESSLSAALQRTAAAIYAPADDPAAEPATADERARVGASSGRPGD